MAYPNNIKVCCAYHQYGGQEMSCEEADNKKRLEAANKRRDMAKCCPFHIYGGESQMYCRNEWPNKEVANAKPLAPAEQEIYKGVRGAYEQTKAAEPVNQFVTTEKARKQGVLEEAITLVSGPRQKAYDHPKDNYRRIAAGWEQIVEANAGIIDPPTAALMMIWLKLVRQAHCSKRDNLVDIAGYAKVAAIIEGMEEL